MTLAAALAAALGIGAAAALAGGCARTEPITSCADSLRGVWRSEAGHAWMILDRGPRLEAYPLFDDARPEGASDPDLVLAPRAIDLVRTGHDLRGEISRRYMRGADSCIAATAVRITACTTDRLELVLSDPAPPITFTPCTWARPASSRVERWRRE